MDVHPYRTLTQMGHSSILDDYPYGSRRGDVNPYETLTHIGLSPTRHVHPCGMQIHMGLSPIQASIFLFTLMGHSFTHIGHSQIWHIYLYWTFTHMRYLPLYYTNPDRTFNQNGRSSIWTAHAYVTFTHK